MPSQTKQYSVTYSITTQLRKCVSGWKRWSDVELLGHLNSQQYKISTVELILVLWGAAN